MKVYIICFNNETIAYPKVFLDRELAEKRLKEIQDRWDREAHELQMKSYAHWYSVDEMEAEAEDSVRGLPSDEQREAESSASEAPSEPEAKE